MGIQLTQEIYDLFCLLYADDIVIFADSIIKLQHLIDILYKFCTKWRMEVNLDKTKIIVFRKGGHLSRWENWHFGGKSIDVVSYYKYLGLMLSSRNNWSKAIFTLASQASKALNMLSITRWKLEYFDFHTHFRLFDTMILPILCYGSEIWGYLHYDVLEKIQRKWCRKFLGVPNHTTNEAVLGECGRLPIYFHTLKRCIRFWLKLIELPDNRLPKQAYKMLHNLDNLGRHTWATSIKNILFSFGFGFVWLSQEVGNKELFLSSFEMRVTDLLKQQWFARLSLKPKMRLYVQYKSMLEPEKYLKLHCCHNIIRIFACFRCGVLPLAIEEGRRENVDALVRVCKVCSFNSVEDEYHFLLVCPLYSELRKEYLPRKIISEPNVYKFNKLLNSNNSEEIFKLCHFVYKAFKLREQTLSQSVNM